MIVSSGNRRGSRKAEILQHETGKSIHGNFRAHDRIRHPFYIPFIDVRL